MTNVYIKYNPYTVESEIKIDGVLVQKPNKLAEFTNQRMQVWIDDLIPVLNEMCNDDNYEIEFYGTSLDYNDLTICINDYCYKNSDVSVRTSFTEAKSSEHRFQELISLFNDMQKNCPFEDLTTDQIKENFNKAISSEFEVSVIATMSSGKSTLINSLLGRELLPSKNAACTATIARIKDDDEMDHFEAVYYDKNNNELGRYNNLTLDEMAEMNDNEQTAVIDIVGDIPNIESKNVQLILVDTPGPNNSKEEEHHHHDRTYRIIKEKTKPMVLYVLNATQLQTNDDNELLTTVSEAMKVGGKQSRDRFLFAVNKIDNFDPEKESIPDAINNVKEYLRKFDIEDPNIFPTSAEFAKLIRMAKNGQELTQTKKRTLRDCDLFIEEEQLHLSEQATLSKDNMNKIKEQIKEARDAGDIRTEALIHTGIPAVELAIDEYLKKYAYTAKVKTAVDTFKKKVEEKNLNAKMMQIIQNDEKERENTNAQLRAVKAQIEEGKTGEEFRKEIQNLNMMKEADERIKKLRTKINKIVKNSNSKKEMTMLEVSQMMAELDMQIRNLQSDVKTELENIMEDVINKGGKEIIERYRKQMHQLITNGVLKTNDYSGKCNISFLEESIPDAQQLVYQYKYTQSVDTGETETVKNYEHKWWDVFELFEPRKITRKIFQDVEMVDFEKVYNDYIDPIMVGFGKNIDNARKAANEEAEHFKSFFLIELDSLEEALKQKVDENEKLTRNQENINKKLKEDKEKIEWLNVFTERLDAILEI